MPGRTTRRWGLRFTTFSGNEAVLESEMISRCLIRLDRQGDVGGEKQRAGRRRSHNEAKLSRRNLLYPWRNTHCPSLKYSAAIFADETAWALQQCLSRAGQALLNIISILRQSEFLAEDRLEDWSKMDR